MIFVIVFGIVAMVFALTAFTGAPYVPTQRREVESAFAKLYRPGKGDVVLDLGAGDGVVLRAAAKHGARAVGVEINPLLVLVMKWRFRREPQVTVRWGNLFRFPFPAETTVVYVFGDSRDNGRIVRRITAEAKRLGHPVKIVSYGFEFPELKPVRQHRAHFLYEIS